MNLYFRFWLILWQSLRAKAQNLLAPSQLRFTVFPTDCDLNLHLTNSRYLSFMDLGRTHLLGQTDHDRGEEHSNGFVVGHLGGDGGDQDDQ